VPEPIGGQFNTLTGKHIPGACATLVGVCDSSAAFPLPEPIGQEI
jgi:hypothetical protein